MTPHQDRPRLASRAATAVGISALLAVAVAARYQGAPQTAAPAQPPAATAAATAASVPDAAVQDSTRTDSTTAPAADTVTMVVSTTPAPTPTPPGTWPVDPATGQTLINGEPVVGRVFVMQKTDGLVKLGTWQAQYNGEPPAPEPAVVATSNAVPALEHSRRMRGIMIQATLWDLDNKRSAVERRYYRQSTTGAALGQQP